MRPKTQRFFPEVWLLTLLEYDVILAVLLNGEAQSIRDKGRFWLSTRGRNRNFIDDIYNVVGKLKTSP